MQRKILNTKKVRSEIYIQNGLEKLHSIPILNTGKNNSNKYMKKDNVLYSIPCVAALLLVGISCLLNLSGLFSNSCSAATSTSLTIDGASSKNITETLTPNETKYVSSNITYSATDTSAYTLKLTYANGSNGLKLDSSGSNVTIADVVDNTTGSSIKNAWGYSWTPSSTAESDYPTLKYRPIPAYGSNADSGNIETGTTINSTTKKMIFAANLSDSNPTGHYKTNLLLSLVATPKAATYTLTLNNNGGTGGTTSKTCTTYTNSCEIKLSEGVTAPTKDGYTFLGWADDQNATTAQYTTSSTITMSADRTIYAVWKLDDPWASITTMQQMTSAACSAAPIDRSKTLTDSRDNSAYTIRKMKDGRCWMTSNLKITGTIQASESDFTSPTSLTIPNSSSGFNSSSSTSLKGYISSKNTGYYNWYTATAQTGTSSISTDGQSVSASICPKGWTLPTGGSGGEFEKMYQAEGSPNITSLLATPYNFSYVGSLYSGMSSSALEQYGSWWSRTVHGAGYVYYFMIIGDYSSVNTSAYDAPGEQGTYLNNMYGFAVRCIAISN